MFNQRDFHNIMKSALSTEPNQTEPNQNESHRLARNRTKTNINRAHTMNIEQWALNIVQA